MKASTSCNNWHCTLPLTKGTKIKLNTQSCAQLLLGFFFHMLSCPVSQRDWVSVSFLLPCCSSMPRPLALFFFFTCSNCHACVLVWLDSTSLSECIMAF